MGSVSGRCTVLLACLSLLPGASRTEPFLMRDARALAPWTFLVEGSVWWGSSRGGFDSEGNLLSLEGTPGIALIRGVSGTLRAGMPLGLEAAFSDEYLQQEVKIDRTDAAGNWNGSDLYRGEGEGDKVLTLMWTALEGGNSALALEAGLKMPTARGPEKAANRYERLGDGAWAYPVGLRMTHEQGVVCVYMEGFWQWAASRRVAEWYGIPLSTRQLYRPGTEYRFSAGAEVGTPYFSWALEISREVTERDRGEVGSVVVPGLGNGLEPRRESLVLAPSLILPATRSGEIRLAGLVPISGRNIYQVFTVALSVRRYF